MIQIDDDRFIDDTLITCAEYQLFLDEMRQQGKFFQPDHWQKSQFPSGQAQTPLRGMRPSDTIAFCKWLADRELGEWEFRLPTKEEAYSYPLSVSMAPNIGYWVQNPSDQEIDFIWVSTFRLPIPTQESINNLNRCLDLDRMLERSHDLASDADLDDDSSLREARVIYRGLGSDIARSRGSTSITVKPDLASEFDLACARAIFRGLEGDVVNVHYLADAQTRSAKRLRASDIDIFVDVSQALDRSRDRTLYLKRVIDIVRDVIRDLADEINRASDSELATYIYEDLRVLDKRIKGQLDPLEGIRIIQERKRISNQIHHDMR